MKSFQQYDWALPWDAARMIRVWLSSPYFMSWCTMTTTLKTNCPSCIMHITALLQYIKESTFQPHGHPSGFQNFALGVLLTFSKPSLNPHGKGRSVHHTGSTILYLKPPNARSWYPPLNQFHLLNLPALYPIFCSFFQPWTSVLIYWNFLSQKLLYQIDSV